jgi:hypothetical protein
MPKPSLPRKTKNGFVQKLGNSTFYLDSLRSAVIGAYGAGRIFSPSIYNGACLRLKTLGNDINFTAQGLVDTAAIDAAAGASAAYADILYNQTGGSNLTSAGTAPNMPRVKAASTAAITGLYCVTGGTHFTAANIWAGLTRGSAFCVLNLNGGSGGWARIGDGSQTLTHYVDGYNYDTFLSTARQSASNGAAPWSYTTYQHLYVEQNGAAIQTVFNSFYLASVAATFDNTPTNIILPEAAGGTMTVLEWIFFNRPLSITERQLVEGSAAWRYKPAVTEPLDSLPASHPYRSRPPSWITGPYAMTSNPGTVAPMFLATQSGGGGGGGGGGTGIGPGVGVIMGPGLSPGTNSFGRGPPPRP